MQTESPRGTAANGYKKATPQPDRLSLHEAVARWGDDWAIWAPREFSRQRIVLDMAQRSEEILMRCYEEGRIPRVRQSDLA